jgi:HK97 family phage major capsid protein
MNISDRIKASETELVSMKDALVEATKALEAAPDEQSLLIEVEALSDRVEKQASTVAALKKAEKALADRAVAASPVAPAVISGGIKRDANGDGSLLWKMATAKFLAFSGRTSADEVIATQYSDDNRVKAAFDLTQKAVVNPAMTTTTGWAAELVRTDYQGFLNSLRTVSVAAELAAKSQRLDFGGYDSVTVPVRNPLGATLTEPSFVGEAGSIPLTQFSFGSMRLNRYKLAAITTMSREIADRSTPAIEGLLRDALTEAYAQVLDSAMLSAAAAVVGVRPAGLLNNVTTAAGTAGGGEAAVLADMKTMISAMTAARLGARPVLLIPSANRLSLSLMMNPLGQRSFADEIAAGRLLGLEVISSQHVPANMAILVDASTLATAFDTPMFDVSDVATVVESNANGTAPTMAATSPQAAVGAVGTAGQVPVNSGIAVAGSTGAATTNFQARSLWQTYSVGIRMVAPTSWGLMRGATAVQGLTAISW